MHLKKRELKDLNVKDKTIKLLEEKIREKLHDNRFGHFLNMTMKAQIQQKENRQIELH